MQPHFTGCHPAASYASETEASAKACTMVRPGRPEVADFVAWLKEEAKKEPR